MWRQLAAAALPLAVDAFRHAHVRQKAQWIGIQGGKRRGDASRLCGHLVSHPWLQRQAPGSLCGWRRLPNAFIEGRQPTCMLLHPKHETASWRSQLVTKLPRA